MTEDPIAALLEQASSIRASIQERLGELYTQAKAIEDEILRQKAFVQRLDILEGRTPAAPPKPKADPAPKEPGKKRTGVADGVLKAITEGRDNVSDIASHMGFDPTNSTDRTSVAQAINTLKSKGLIITPTKGRYRLASAPYQAPTDK